MEVRENCIMRSFITCTLHQVQLEDQVKEMRWAGSIACMGEKMNAYKVFVEKPKGVRSLGRPRCRWEDYIKMDIGEIG
jgi:hypothetical protein